MNIPLMIHHIFGTFILHFFIEPKNFKKYNQKLKFTLKIL